MLCIPRLKRAYELISCLKVKLKEMNSNLELFKNGSPFSALPAGL